MPVEPGTEWVWLVEIEAQGGQVYAYSTKKVDPTGGPSFNPGLAPIQVERSASLSSISITIEGGEDWTALYRQGVVLEFSPSSVALWAVGSDYSERIRILEGKLQDLEWGGYGADRSLVATIRSRPAQPQLWPPTTWVVDATTHPPSDTPPTHDAAEVAKGATYPIPIGYPGKGDDPSTDDGIPATPTLMAYWDNNPTSGDNFCVVGPDILDATDVEFIRTDADGFADGTQRAIATLETETDALGLPLAVVKFPIWWIYAEVQTATSGAGTVVLRFNIPAGTPTTGTIYLLDAETNAFDAYAYSSWSADTVTLDAVTLSTDYPAETNVRFEGQVTVDPAGQYWVSFSSEVGRGGGIKALGESPLRSLGKVLIYCLENSGERLDRTRALAEAARLESFKVDTVISGRVDLATWADTELASVFPISRAVGPDGVYFKFMNYLADQRHATLHLDLDRGDSCTQIGPVRTDTAAVANQFAIVYAPSQMTGGTKRVQIGPTYQGDVSDTRILRNESCELSFNRYTKGQIIDAAPIQTPHIFSDSTAYAVLAHRAARNAFPVISLEIECYSLPFLEIGQIVVLTSERHGWVKHPAIIISTTLAGTWQTIGVELLRSKVLT